MKIAELLMNIKNKEFKLERGLEVKKYLPIETKKTIAQAIIYDCSSTEQGVIKIDSVERYMSYVRYMITTHTNLDYTDENYDALCSTTCGDTTLLNAIMDCFEADAKECMRILNLMTDDVIRENAIEFSVGKLLYNINNSLGDLTGEMKKKIDGFDINEAVVNGIKEEQFNNVLNK